jgi:hypothetical protein
MSKDTVDFYTKGHTFDAKHHYEKLLRSIVEDGDAMLEMATNADLLNVVLPVGEHLDTEARSNLSHLYKDAEPGKRYHAIVVLMLERLGLELINPVAGIFATVQPEQHPFTLLAFESHIMGSTEMPSVRGRALLQRLIFSTAWCGLTHYSRQLSNMVVRLYCLGRVQNRAICQWLIHTVNGTIEPLSVCCPKRNDFRPLHSAVYLSELAAPDVPPDSPGLIRRVRPMNKQNDTTVCKHGVFKRMKNINGVKKMACIMVETDQDCGEVETM